MIVARGTEYVCSWHYRLGQEPGTSSMSSQWKAATQAIQAVCRVAARAQLLLYPLQAKIFFGLGPEYPPSQIAAVAGDGDLALSIRSLVESGDGRAADLQILAPSVVFGLGEHRSQSDVFGINCYVTAAAVTIAAWTRADIWMPYNLMAQPQPEVAALNAPRLRAALEAIEQIVGKPGYAEDSRFAKVDGYELRNHIVRGDVLDLQDMGYDESWIADRWPEPDPPDPPPGPAGA